MVYKRFWLGMLLITFIFCSIFTSCWSSGEARESLPQTAVTIQRVQVSATLLGEILGSANVSLDTPMQIGLYPVTVTEFS